MNRSERMTLIKWAIRNLDNALDFMPGYGECDEGRSKEAIKRIIFTIWYDLKTLEEELDNE